MSKSGTKINVELVTHGCFPTKSYETDAAYDLHCSKDTEVIPNKRFYVPLGFKIQLPSNMKMLIQPRSGMSGKGMLLEVYFPSWLLHGDYLGKVRANLDVILGLIDCGYGDEVHAIVKSGRWRLKHRIMRMLGFKFVIPYTQRICQGAFTYVPDTNLELGKVTGTRSGLGSTDKN